MTVVRALGSRPARGSRCREKSRSKRPEKADGHASGSRQFLQRSRKIPLCRPFADGETRTRTGDTTIFSRVLYQLSYLAVESRA